MNSNKMFFTWAPAHSPRPHPGLCRAMEYRQISTTPLRVSPLCFGTMLFGESTDEALAHTLLNVAAEAGINFWDSAEMYSIPQRKETQGRSELILGRWLCHRSRSDFVVSTKVAGPGGMEWLRGGPTCLDAANIMQAIDGSLERLQTDYIDLIQLHWPDRYVPMFGTTDFDPSMSYPSIPMEEQLEALTAAVHAGKVRYFGLSNETPWGLMKFCNQSSAPLPLNNQNSNSNSTNNQAMRPVVLQNAYSLTCRTFDSSGLAECCFKEHVSLLAYSPLAMGLLTGKYLDPGGGPPQARLNKYKGRYAEAESRYGPKPNVQSAVAAYVDIAHRWGISPTQLAIRFVLGHPLVAAAVFGATGVEQMHEVVAAAEVGCPLSDELRAEIDAVHARYPNPTP